MLARDKRSSLLWKVVTYGCKKFYNLGTWGQSHEEIYLVFSEGRPFWGIENKLLTLMEWSSFEKNENKFTQKKVDKIDSLSLIQQK